MLFVIDSAGAGVAGAVGEGGGIGTAETAGVDADASGAGEGLAGGADAWLDVGAEGLKKVDGVLVIGAGLSAAGGDVAVPGVDAA